ncbi:DUF6701 domain-containing protein [Thiorhodospira sibirica]|uniref:DUF6701 domain-containing protein n=1 Tax=Thiorhodospira sibirica TaxID=154347 RepID=UPI00111249AA|nr:DUF6701 domain-containing protein [Thiorhodospira sibirica]
MNRLLAILLLILLCLPGTGWARDFCSPHIGKATINEVYELGNEEFVEIKKIVPMSVSDAYTNWKVQVCSKQGQNSVCETLDIPSTQNGNYIVLSSNRVDLRHNFGMEVLLKDSNGLVVDYLSVNGYKDNEPTAACLSQLLYDWKATTTSQSKGIHRLPDGTGSWQQFGTPGATYDNSKNDSNDAYYGNEVYAFISIPDTVVYPGQPAVFTLTLRNEAGEVVSVPTNETLTVRYTTLDGTATAPTHYTKPDANSYVTLQEGASTATFSIPTTSHAELGKYFYLVVTDISVNDGSSVILMQDSKNYAKATFVTAPLEFKGDQCFIDEFDREALGQNWVVSNSSHGNPVFQDPTINVNRLRLTNAEKNIATMATLQRTFPLAGNFIQIEFDYYTYDKESGADGVAVVLSDAAITPSPGGYGGSLGYAKRHNIGGFAGGFLGIGLDTHGNYSNPVDGGKIGGPGQKKHSVALRGPGSGTSGYIYLSGTETLAPNLITTTGHRYRVTLDSRQDGKYWVTLERDTTGNNYEIIISPVDLLTVSSDYTTPENLILSLTGSTGGAVNFHEIDNLRLCANNIKPIAPDLDHIRLEHATQGLTCEAETVTVKACADANCTELYEGEVTVQLGFDGNPDGASWESSSITFSGGQGEAKLRMTQLGEVTLKVESATDQFVCVSGNETTDCTIEFADVGVRIGRFTDNDFDGGILTQIAGKPSNQGWERSDLYVQVIRKDDNTGACVAAVAGTQNVRFSYSIPEPKTQGLVNNAIKIHHPSDSNSFITLNSSSDSNSLALTFDNEDGKAPFYFVSNDTGKYQLTASLDIGVGVAGEEEPPTVTVTGQSNSFVVRPLAVFVDAPADSVTKTNPKAVDHNGGVFTKAGEGFDLTFTPVRWMAKADDDDNEDGIWDQCGKPDFSVQENAKARVPRWDFPGPQPSLRLPEGGKPGDLSYPDNNGASSVSFADEKLETTVKGVSYSEVGIIQFSTGADPEDPESINTVDFLGEDVAVCSPHIGRFIPHHFHIVPGSVTGACGSFTYFGQDGFITDFTLQARNKQEGITENYTGDFAKLGSEGWSKENFEINLPDGSSHDLSSDVDYPKVSWDKGSAKVEVKHLISRPSSPTGPLRLTIQAKPPIDSDSVTTSGPMTVHTTGNGPELRYGRLTMGTGHAHLETDPVEVTVEAQYFDGTRWVLNTADNCTHLGARDFRLSNDQQENQTGSIRVSDNVNSISILKAHDWAGGKQTLELSPPGENNSGFVDITALLNDKPWLQYDWGSGNVVTDNPTGRASWGLYRGHPNVIYLREIWR